MGEDHIGKLLLTWVVAIVADVVMQDRPKLLNYCQARHVYMPEMAD